MQSNLPADYRKNLDRQDPDRVMLEKKYASPRIGEMTDIQQNLWADALILKIHVITGWVIPEKDLMNVLTDQFQKKLIEDYSHLNVDEIEYAFRKSGTTIKDWGKAMNLALIDEVLIPYTNQRLSISADEERKKSEPPPTKIYTDAQLEDLHRGDIEAFYQRLRKGIVPRGIPDYFEPILLKDGLLKPAESMAQFFTNWLGKGMENVYVKSK